MATTEAGIGRAAAPGPTAPWSWRNSPATGGSGSCSMRKRRASVVRIHRLATGKLLVPASAGPIRNAVPRPMAAIAENRRLVSGGVPGGGIGRPPRVEAATSLVPAAGSPARASPTGSGASKNSVQSCRSGVSAPSTPAVRNPQAASGRGSSPRNTTSACRPSSEHNTTTSAATPSNASRQITPPPPGRSSPVHSLIRATTHWLVPCA